jgi:hypothetical protein
MVKILSCGSLKGTRSDQSGGTSHGLVAGGSPSGRSVRSNRKAHAVLKAHLGKAGKEDTTRIDDC